MVYTVSMVHYIITVTILVMEAIVLVTVLRYIKASSPSVPCSSWVTFSSLQVDLRLEANFQVDSPVPTPSISNYAIPPLTGPYKIHEMKGMASLGVDSILVETNTPKKPLLLESENMASVEGDSTLVETDTPTKPSSLKINNTASFEEDPLLEIDASLLQEDTPGQLASSILKTKEIPQRLDHVDPDGDVDIILGQPGMLSSIRVSSKFLSVVSPVFRTMFSPDFSEGQNLSASSPREVRLLDDYPEAMIWLLRALHWHPEVNRKPLFYLRKKIVYLCDKYHCTARLGVYFEPWIHDWLDSCIGKEHRDPLDMLCLSYTLKDPKMFYWSTANVIEFCQDEDFPGKDDDADYLPLSILPERLLPSLKARIDGVVVTLGESLDNVVSTFVGPNDGNNNWGRKCPLDASSSDCPREAQVDHYFRELQRLDLSPRSKLPCSSLSRLLRQCKQYRPYKKYLGKTRASELPECDCFFGQLDAKQGMWAIDHELDRGGICLQCFMAGRVDGNGKSEWGRIKKVGNCRCKYQPGVCCYTEEEWVQEGDEGGDGDNAWAWNDEAAAGMAGSW